MAKKARSAKQKAATKNMIAANKAKGGGKKRGKRSAAKSTARKSNRIPISILKKRLTKLTAIVKSRS